MLKSVLAAAAALLVAQPGAAAVITRTYVFAATDASAPISGSVTVSFDPAVSARSLPDASVDAANLRFHRPISASYDRAGDTLAIASADFGEADEAFALTIRGASAERPLSGTLQLPSGDGAVTARAVAVTPGPPARLPEPATWAMLVMGFGLIGWLARAHQRRSEAAFTERLRRIADGELE